MSISADGQYIAAGSEEDYVYLFHKDSSTPIWKYKTNRVVYSVTISADSQYIIVGSDVVYFFNKDSNEPLWTYEVDTDYGYVRSVDISAAGKYNAVISGSIVFLFDRDIDTNSNNNEDMPCQNGDIKAADDSCNQCVCSEGAWVCTEVDCKPEDNAESFLPSLSLISVSITIGFVSVFRRK